MRKTILAAVMVVSGLTTGCSGLPRLSWPWAKPPVTAPAPVDELRFTGGTTTAIPLYWQGNTLVLDLTGVSANGTAVAMPNYARGWPMRIAARARPGQFGALEVRGAQRVSLPLTTEGTGTVDLPIPPEVYAPGTSELTLGWGAVSAPAVIFPQAPTPAPQASPTR